MSTSIAHQPAYKLLNWIKIPDEAKDTVEAALTKKTDDTAGKEELTNVWRAAEVVEKFSGTLVSLRTELDDLNGPRERCHKPS